MDHYNFNLKVRKLQNYNTWSQLVPLFWQDINKDMFFGNKRKWLDFMNYLIPKLGPSKSQS